MNNKNGVECCIRLANEAVVVCNQLIDIRSHMYNEGIQFSCHKLS